MSPRPPAPLALATILSIALAPGGCSSEGDGSPADASADRPTATAGGGAGNGTDASVGRDGGAPADLRPPPDAAPATPNPAAIKLLPGGTDLLGSFLNGCTTGPGAERWCAVSRPLALTRRELWLVNITRAAMLGANVAACDVPGLCLKATDQLYTAQPEEGPAYPEGVARASGNTFIYLTDPVSSASDPFQGDVWVHTVGAPAATKIGEDVLDCAVVGQRQVRTAGGERKLSTVAGICAGEPLSAPDEEPPFFTMMAGVVAGQQAAPPAQPPTPPLGKTPGLLPVFQTIYPIHPQTGASRYRIGFSADGEQLVLSHGGASLAEAERLTTIRTADIGKPGVAATAVPGTGAATRWTLSADGTRIFYLQDYNYNVMGNQSGTLAMADFPGGGNPRKLTGSRVPGGPMGGVAAYRVLVDGAGRDGGLGVLSGLVAARGNYAIIKDPRGSLDDPANVVTVAMRSGGVPLPSSDLRFSLFPRTLGAGTSDLWLVANDGSGECALTNGILGQVLTPGPIFTRSSGLVLWADNFDAATGSAEGWLTDPADCQNAARKRRWSDNVDFWFVDGDRLLLYSEANDGQRVSIRYAPIQGNVLGPPVTIQTGADLDYRIVLDEQPADGSPPRWKGVVYTLSGGGETDGVYYHELPAGS